MANAASFGLFLRARVNAFSRVNAGPLGVDVGIDFLLCFGAMLEEGAISCSTPSDPQTLGGKRYEQHPRHKHSFESNHCPIYAWVNLRVQSRYKLDYSSRLPGSQRDLRLCENSFEALQLMSTMVRRATRG